MDLYLQGLEARSRGSYRAALKLFEQAACPEAQFELFCARLDVGALARSAEGGFAPAQAMYGLYTAPPNEWLARALASGNAFAHAYLLSRRVVRAAAGDDEVALWERSAATGFAHGQYELGLALLRRARACTDAGAARPMRERAVEVMTRAAEQGLAPAAYRLGWLLCNGDGLGPDSNVAEAVPYFAIAAKQSHALSVVSLAHALFYADDEPVRDLAAGAAWLVHALVALDDAPAGTERLLVERLTMDVAHTPERLGELYVYGRAFRKHPGWAERFDAMELTEGV